MPPDVAQEHGVKLDQTALVADPKELGVCDATLETENAHINPERGGSAQTVV